MLKKHVREDYRSATSIAIDALKHDKRVLWQADMNATRYYANRIGDMRYFNALQQLESDPTGLLLAYIVVVNRPDIRIKEIDYYSKLRKATSSCNRLCKALSFGGPPESEPCPTPAPAAAR